MNRISALIILLAALCVSPAYTPVTFGGDQDMKIFWASRKLKWDDFQARPDQRDPNKAFTFYNTTFSSDAGTDSIKLVVKVYFEKNKSWVKPEGQTDYLLGHEQLHFDIGELYTRMLRKRLKQAHFTNKNFSTECNSIFSEMNKKGHEVQQQYDKETNHSINKEAQAKWAEKISKQLKEYAGWQGDDVMVKVK